MGLGKARKRPYVQLDPQRLSPPATTPRNHWRGRRELGSRPENAQPFPEVTMGFSRPSSGPLNDWGSLGVLTQWLRGQAEGLRV